MLRFHLLLIFSLAFSFSVFSQIEPEHTYPQASNQESTAFSQLSIAPLELSGCKYVFVDKQNFKISLFHLDHSLFHQFSIPDSPFNETAYYEVLLISQQLFDKDPKIEFLITGEDANFERRTMILNEDGLVLLEEEGAWLMGRQDDRSGRGALYRTKEGVKMILSYDNGEAKVFGLPGDIPAADCLEGDLVRIENIKGSKTIVNRVDTIYLNGLRIEKQRDTLVVTQEEYDEMREEVGKAIPLKDLSPNQLQPGMRIGLTNVRFERSSAKMIKGSTDDLKQLVNLMKENPEMTIRLEGHTDRRTESLMTSSNNKQLSLRRVYAVRNYLAKKGISPARVAIEGYGGSRPIASNEQEETRKLNRRVEVYIVNL